MMLAIFVAAVVVFMFSAVADAVDAQTPPPIPCLPFLCEGKVDGSYKHPHFINFFIQCTNYKPICSSCWPLSLVYKEECNQCLYSFDDECVTTKPWTPPPTQQSLPCPNLCEKKPNYEGNLADPNEPTHFVACWKGYHFGCIECPKGLKFNEQKNQCLYR